MKAIGIVCELNPPHLGHKRLFDLARKQAGDGAIVAVMSGNFVQRGEPAVFLKHARAAAALSAGVDLVLELPLPYALSSAEGFASAAVEILSSVSPVGTIAFGAECGDIEALRRAAAALELPECAEKIKSGLADGGSYARSCQLALEDIIGSDAYVLEAPNNMLAIQYLRAAFRRGDKLEAVCMKREPGITASGLRRELHGNCTAPPDILPPGILPYGEPVFPEDLETAALSRLRALPEEAFFSAPGASGGIAERAARFSKTAGSAEELAFAIKTKRHTLSRIRRYLMCLALGITDDLPLLPPYIRLLGSNERGLAILKTMENRLPVITKPADGRRLGGDISRLIELEAGSTDFYSLGFKSPEMRRGGAEWRTSPVVHQ